MAFTYSVIDSFCISFLLILFISTRERSERLVETLWFRMIVIMTICALVFDLVAWQLDGRAGRTACVLLWAANILCYMLSGAMSAAWLYYTGLMLNRGGRVSKWVKALAAFPFFFLEFVALLTPWTHWLFYIDGGNVYQRGELFAIQMVVPFGYIVAAALWALRLAYRERSRQQRKEYLALSSFVIFPLLGGLLQLAVYGISLAWPCTALSLMLVYVSMQNQRISLDALTGLNNRGQFDKQLYGCFERAEDGPPFALFMLDIDDFKRINDENGHTVGDVALIEAAGILKRALTDTNAFLARYGGDEFAVILYYSEEKQIPALLARIAQESERWKKSADSPYDLNFSVGYSCYDRHRFANYQDMITAADAQMYIQKRQHKAERKSLRQEADTRA